MNGLKGVWQGMLVVTMFVFLSMGAARKARAQYAAAVISYDAGSTAAAGYDDSSAALGWPERLTGEGVFPGAVSPFNPPFGADEIVSIGEGGQLTLRLSHFAIPQASTAVLGFFTNAGLIDSDYPNGQAAGVLGETNGTFGIDRAIVEVSADNVTYASLGEIVFEIPTNGYTDLTNPFSSSAGAEEADFQQPFTGTLSDFAGQVYAQAGSNNDMVDLLGGSGGGTWLDLSSSGLTQVGYVRLSVPDDVNATTLLNFELDAVVIGHGFAGAAVPEPASGALLLVAGSWLMVAGRSFLVTCGTLSLVPKPLPGNEGKVGAWQRIEKITRGGARK